MLGGKGFFRGSSILVSGTAGSGKSSLGAHFARAACAGKGRCLYFAFEESPAQIVRNMRSIGLDLAPLIKAGSLKILAARPSLHGLETHLAVMHKEVTDFDPDAVIVDPLSSISAAGAGEDVAPMILRLVDFLKGRGITAMFNCLAHGGDAVEATTVGISSLMDTWILLRDIEVAGERNRGIYILKSRGMGHSNQIREFVLTDRGIKLQDPYVGPEGVLTGSARVAQESRDSEREAQLRIQSSQRKAEIARRRAALEAQIVAIKSELAGLSTQETANSDEERDRLERVVVGRAALTSSRGMAASAENGDRSHASRRSR
jgi:circadian clock protein KaiC